MADPKIKNFDNQGNPNLRHFVRLRGLSNYCRFRNRLDKMGRRILKPLLKLTKNQFLNKAEEHNEFNFKILKKIKALLFSPLYSY